MLDKGLPLQSSLNTGEMYTPYSSGPGSLSSRCWWGEGHIPLRFVFLGCPFIFDIPKPETAMLRAPPLVSVPSHSPSLFSWQHEPYLHDKCELTLIYRLYGSPLAISLTCGICPKALHTQLRPWLTQNLCCISYTHAIKFHLGLRHIKRIMKEIGQL